MWNEIKNIFSPPYDTIFFVKLAVVLGGLIYLFTAGLSDVLRFSIKRIWAISGVCFDESIRRRVLWIIPLAILGLVVVVQLQQPLDEQDAIGETTKFCLFATGLVVVISTIILACTNLPREIENRVIFTVVTKPTTRLEIVLGKITGFARVSATILLIMGIFSFGYLHFGAWSLETDLRDRLKANLVETISRPRSQHYVDARLLNAKTLTAANTMNIYGQQPLFNNNKRVPTIDGMVLVPFRLPPDMVASADPDGKQFTGPGITIIVKAGYVKVASPTKPGKENAPQPPKVALQVFDQNANTILAAEIKESPQLITGDGTTPAELRFNITSNYAATLTKYPFIYIELANASPDYSMWLDDSGKVRDIPVTLDVPVIKTNPANPQDVSVVHQIVFPTDPQDEKKFCEPIFCGREGVSGMQVKGDSAGQSQVCVYRFHDVNVDHGSRATIPIEIRAGVEKGGDASEDDLTQASISVLNVTTGKESPPISIQPENNRPFYSSIPAEYCEGGNFNLIVRCLSDQQWLNLKRDSIFIVQAENSFAFNLFKSTFIIWLLSILVTSIAVFCSTFLSWPIAVVLTLVILLGRWGVNQLGDAATAGIGRQFVTDFGVKDPATMQVLSESVENLNKALKIVATVLPDIEQFSATDDIERGVNIPFKTIGDGGMVLFGFGIPLTVLAYIFLKNKEVAP